MKMNASTNQVTDDKKLLYPVRVEYKIMEDFKKTLSKRPWEYLEEGNYEKYLKTSEVKKEPSTHRKELLEVYTEILTLIKDKQKHVNRQFVDPKYDLVKHDFKCICSNTIKFQYYPQPYELHKKGTKKLDSKVSEKKKALEQDEEPKFKVKELDLAKLKVPDVTKGEKPQFVSSRRDSDYTETDPVVVEYFDTNNVKTVETKLKKKGTKKVGVKEPPKRKGTTLVKFDVVSEESFNKNLDSDITSSDLSKKPSKKEKHKETSLEHKNTYDVEELMVLPSLDIETLLERKQSYKREQKVEPKADVVSPPVKVPSSTKKSSDSVNLEGDKVNQQEAEMRNDLLHLLESVPVFSDLPKSRLPEIIKHFKLKSYFARSSIILAGEVPQEFYIVASGTVSSFTYEGSTQSIVYKRTYLCSEYFGETFLMDDTVSDEFYVADSHVTVQSISASVFKTVLSDLFDAFRNRNKEFNNYGTCRYNTFMAPSKYFTNMELDKFASGDNTVKAKSVLGSELMEFLNSYPSLAKFKYLEKLSKRFSYQEYLAKEILIGVCKNDNLFLVYKGTVSLQVYEEELNRQLELVSFGPGTFFFRFKYKSDLVSSLMERSSFVAKDKVVLLCLEDKYVEKYLGEIVSDMSVYLENLYKSNYLTLEKNKYKYLHSDQSSSSSKTVHSGVDVEKEAKKEHDQTKEQKESKTDETDDDDKSVQEEPDLVSDDSLKSEEVDKTDASSVVSSSSTSVLSSTSREDSSRHTRSSRSDGPGDDKFDVSSRTSGGDNYSPEVSDVQSRSSDKEHSSQDRDQYQQDKMEQKCTSVHDLHEKLDKTKMSKKFSDSFSFTGAIVSRKSFEDPCDVSIRSSLPNQLESSRTVSSVDSSKLGKLQSQVFNKDDLSESKELESARSVVTTEKNDNNLLASSLNKLNEVLKTVGMKQTDSGSDKSVDRKSSPSSKSSKSGKSLSSSKDDEDFMDKLMNKIEDYRLMLNKSDTSKDGSDKGEKEDNEEDKDGKNRLEVDEEELIRRITEEDFELIRKNTLLASHVNISDTEPSSRSHVSQKSYLSNVLNQSYKSSLPKSQSFRSEKTDEDNESSRKNKEDTDQQYQQDREVISSMAKERGSGGESSLREGSSFKESSNVGKDSEVSSVGSDVKFIFNLDNLKSGEFKSSVKYVIGLPKMKNLEEVVDDAVDKKKDSEEENVMIDRLDSSRVMGNDNFVDIRSLTAYYGNNLNNMGTGLSMSDMGISNIYQETESLLKRERSEMSGKIVYRNTSSSHLLTSRTTNENILEPEDLSSVAKELGDVEEQVELEPSVEVPSLDMKPKLEDRYLTENKDKQEQTKGQKEYTDRQLMGVENEEYRKDKDEPPLDSHRSVSSLDNLINKNYPGVEESLNSVMEVIRTRTLELNNERTLTDLNELYPSKQESLSEQKGDHQDLVETMGTIDNIGILDEKNIDKSPSLDFGEVPNLSKILSRVHEMYVNPDLPVESVSGSKFPSIDDVYVQLDKIEKLHQSKTFDDVVNKEEKEEKLDVNEANVGLLTSEKDDKKEKEVESLFDLNQLYKQSSYTSNKTLGDDIYDSDRDEVVPYENTEKQLDDDSVDKKENEVENGKQFDLSFENLKNKLTNELSIDNLSKQLSIENFTREMSFDDLTKNLSLDNITKELSNMGSSISSQISGVFSSKSSVIDQQEVNAEDENEDVDKLVGEEESEQKGQDEDGNLLSFYEKSKSIITSIFDNIPLYNSGNKNEEVTDVEQEQKVDEDHQYHQDKDVKKEVEQLLDKENVLIDKYNLVSRISLDSPSNVTSTSSSDREGDLSKQKEEYLSESKELESARSVVTTEKDDNKSEVPSLRLGQKVDVYDGELSTDRSYEAFSSLKTSPDKSLVSSKDDESQYVDEKENEMEEDLVSNVGKDSKDSREEKESTTKTMEEENVLSSSTNKSDSEGPSPLRTVNNYDESVVTTEKDDNDLLTSEKDDVDSHKSFVTSERDTDKYTEKSLISSLDKSEKNQLVSSISVTESMNDTSLLSTESESHLTSVSDSGSYDFKDQSGLGTDRSLDSNQDEIDSILSSMTSNTYITENSDVQSKTSDPLDSGRLSNAESLESYSKRTSSIDSLLTSEKDDKKEKDSGPTGSESSRRTSSIDSNFDSSDQQESNTNYKEQKEMENKDYEKEEVNKEDEDTDSFSDDESDYDQKYYQDNEVSSIYKEYKKYRELKNEDDEDEGFELLEDTLDSEEEEFEYDEEAILSIKNLLMSTLKNKYKSLGASFLAMDFERTGKVTCEVFLSFIEKLGIGAIDHREQNLMFELLKEENQDYITFASFYRCSGEVVSTLAELNQHFISIFGSSRIAFEKFFTTLKKSTMCSQVDFVLILNQVGIGEDYANKFFETLDVCKTQSVTVFTMLKMIVGDWDEKVALENEQKINTNLNRLLTYFSPESLEEFNSEFTRTLSSQFFDQSVEGSLVSDKYEEFYIERDLKYFDILSSLLSEQTQFSGISLAQKRFIVSLFNIIDTSTTPPEAFMAESGQMEDQEVVLVSSKEVEAPLVALINGTMDMDFEGITYPKHLNLTVPCLANYYQFISSLKNFDNQSYSSGYYDNPIGSTEFSQPTKECGYTLSFKLGLNRNTIIGLMPLASYIYNVLPLLEERNRRLPVMLQFLKSVPSFNVYSPDELDKIVSACTVRQFKLHETVIRTGETPTHFYLVFDGTLTVTNEYNFEFKTVGKTEFFSSYDLVNNQLNNFTLIANCSLVLLSWERNEFFRVFNKYSTLVENDACNLNDFENLGLQKLVDKKVSFAECP